MNINPDIFREYSIRGVADQHLTDKIMVMIGWATGVFFKKRGVSSPVVGRDVRHSSERISRSLIGGLVQCQLNVVDVGVVPTPVHHFATDFYQTDGVSGGVMVTASHNPPEYNGLKIRTEHTLGRDELQEIYHLAAKYPQNVATEASMVKRVNPLPDYLEGIKALAQLQSSSVTGHLLKVVVDGGNGTNGQIVAGLLRDLGCKVVELYCEPDGSFPNRGPDPMAPGATDDLSTRVLAEGADLGLAYDGDGDRLAVVDERGQRLLGDQIIMILARDVLRQKPANIVYEVSCTQALADDVSAHGGNPVVTPTGYAFVCQAMRDTGAALGGELSGHIFFNQPNFRFDDAILGTVKLLNIVVQNQSPLSSLVAGLPTYHSTPVLRVSCPDPVKTKVIDQVRKQFENDYKIDTIDGVRIHFDDGWALVRQSNTQPVISMRFEAHSTEQLEVIQTKVQSFVETEISRHIEGTYL